MDHEDEVDPDLQHLPELPLNDTAEEELCNVVGRCKVCLEMTHIQGKKTEICSSLKARAKAYILNLRKVLRRFEKNNIPNSEPSQIDL